MADIEIEIDGKKLTAAPNAMVIQVADAAGIYIPRFCYHKHLTVAANCRMCLVEVEKSPKTMPACATPVAPGMVVFTRSPKALAAQKAVMEFLLINHPLDCPICDQGGECELQDLSLGFGSAESFYHEGKRSVKDKYIGPLIETEMTRCIQCTRCVRFGAEIAGMRELGATGRGENMEIGTYVDHAMKSEVSGNVIDICPVGALTSKPFRFTARAWDLDQRPTISAHDCVGSNLYAHSRYGTVMRMVPRENNMINETWISDRDRFSYEGLYHEDRIKKPRIKKNNVWQETDWLTALEFAATGIASVIEGADASALGALASPNSTVEEFYLLQKLIRGLGSDHIDHRLRQTDFSDQDNLGAFPGLGMDFAELEICDVVLLVGSNIQKEQPSASLRLRKASLKGTKIMAINSYDYAFHFDLVDKQIVAPDEIAGILAGVVATLASDTEVALTAKEKTFVASVEKDKSVAKICKTLKEAKKACILLGNIAFNLPNAATIRQIAALTAKLSNAKLGLLTEGANSAGGWLAGAVPHRGAGCHHIETTGLNADAIWQEPLKAYVLLNVEPDLDCANPTAANAALAQADFVVSLSIYDNKHLSQYADVILPMTPFTETAGTFINAAGEWQKFSPVAKVFEEAKPAWKILRVLGNLFHLEGFDYTTADAVHTDIKAAVSSMSVPVREELKINPKNIEAGKKKTLIRLGSIPLYAGDSIVRRAPALQVAQSILEGMCAAVRVHSATGEKLSLEKGTIVTVRQENAAIDLLLLYDDKLPERAVLVPAGISETAALAEMFGEVELSATSFMSQSETT
jgi:NADH-quinone oxidoreductase subunit G